MNVLLTQDGRMAAKKRLNRGPFTGRAIAVRRAALERKSNLTWPGTPASATSGEDSKRPYDEANNPLLKPSFSMPLFPWRGLGENRFWGNSED